MKALALSFAALGLAGCATLSKITTPGAQPYIQAAVDIAVATTIGNNSATQRDRALQIKAIAQQVLEVDEGSVVPLTQIETIVNQKIAALHLPPGDVAAAQVLLGTLAYAVQQEIQNLSTHGNVTNTTQAAVAEILNDVITATAAYGV